MNEFVITITCVAIMLLYALPGYILVKVKAIKESSISAFAKVLMYVCQPFLTLYAFNEILRVSPDIDNGVLFSSLGIIFGISFLLMFFLLGTFFFVTRKKYTDVRYRVSTVAVGFGNCTFMGVPILEALFPTSPQMALYSTVFFISMSLIGWTVASALISGDKKYIKIKNFVLNPAVVALVVALPLYFTKTLLTGQVATMVSLLGKMTTPMCMLVMGMRLATVKIKELFCSPLQYVAVGVKLLIMPLLMLLIVYFLPIDNVVKMSLVIMSGCPCASIVLNFAEMLQSGQKVAVNEVLLSTVLSVGTLPFVCMLLSVVF